MEPVALTAWPVVFTRSGRPSLRAVVMARTTSSTERAVKAPAGSTGAYFNTVRQTTDGGYVAIGELYVVGDTSPDPTSVLVAKFDADGKLRWQQAFNNLDDQGVPNGYEHALAGMPTSDGGYLAGGNWSSAPPTAFPQEDTAGAPASETRLKSKYPMAEGLQRRSLLLLQRF